MADEINPFHEPPLNEDVVNQREETEHDVKINNVRIILQRAEVKPMAPPPADSPEDLRFFRWSIFLHAAAMFLNFFMFAPVQNVVTTVFPGSATASLIIVYVFFTLGTLIAPSVVRRITPANGLIFGASGYLIYTLGCLSNTLALFMLSSIVVGLCASVIWTSNGAVITLLSNSSNRGSNSSLVVGLTRLAPVFSNILMGYLLNAKQSDGGATFSNAVLFFILFLFGCSGFILFLLLRLRMNHVNRIIAEREAERAEAKRQYESQFDDPSLIKFEGGVARSVQGSVIMTPLGRLLEIFRLIATPNYRHLFPIMFIVQGFGNGWYFGAFGVTMGKDFLGYAQASMNIVAVPCILTIGRALDRVPLKHTSKKKYMLYVTLCGHILLYVLAAITTSLSPGFTSRSPESDQPRLVSSTTFGFLVYFTSMLYGLVWHSSDITFYYFLGMIFHQQSETAFAAKAFAESMGFVISQLVLLILPPTVYPILAAIWTIPVLWWYSRWEFPTEMLQSKSFIGQSQPTHIESPPPVPSSIETVQSPSISSSTHAEEMELAVNDHLLPLASSSSTNTS